MSPSTITVALAYVEVLPDQQGPTCAAFLRRAVAWWAHRKVIVQRVLTDNGSGYRSRAFRDACDAAGRAPSADAALHAAHQRQGGALHSDAAPRVGLRHGVRRLARAAPGAPTLAAVLQPGAAARESRVRHALVTTQVRCLMNNVLDHNSQPALARPSDRSAVTCSSQSTVLPSSCSWMAMCVIAVVGRGAMPVLLAWREPDDVAGRISSIGPPQRCAQAAAGGDDEHLAQRVGVPGRARAGLERHARAAQRGRCRRLEKRVHADRARELLGRCLCWTGANH